MFVQVKQVQQLPWEEVRKSVPGQEGHTPTGLQGAAGGGGGSLTEVRNSGPPAGDRPSGRTGRRMLKTGIKAGAYTHPCGHTCEWFFFFFLSSWKKPDGNVSDCVCFIELSLNFLKCDLFFNVYLKFFFLDVYF